MATYSTVKIRGSMMDKVRELLGGENPTPARVEKLLEELEVRRQIRTGVDEAEAEQAAVALVTGAAPLVAEVPDPEPEPDDEDLDDDEEVDHSTPEASVRIPEPPVASPVGIDGIVASTPTEALLLRLLQSQEARNNQIQAKLEELLKPREVEDRDRAIGAGKLPTSVAEAPPLGFSGPAALPRGTWFMSPFGPQVKMKLCGCQHCQPHRFQHYFCIMCRRGPFAYQGNSGPRGRKVWTAPGSVWGVSHECCSLPCHQRYQELIGVVAGINEFEPPPPESEDGLPDPRALAIGSD